MNRNLSLIIIFGLCVLGPCMVFAASAYASISALGRNPSSAPKIFTAMVLAMAFAEILAFITLLIGFQLFSASPP